MGVVISFAEAAPRARARQSAPSSDTSPLVMATVLLPMAIPLLALHVGLEISRAWWRR